MLVVIAAYPEIPLKVVIVPLTYNGFEVLNLVSS